MKGPIDFFYPWRFYLTWFYRYLHPSIRKNSEFKKEPLSQTFSEDQQVIKLIFFGDLMATKSGQAPSFDSSLIELFKRADFIVGNCECPLTTANEGKHLFLFQMKKGFISSLLKNMKIHSSQLLLTLANNHMGDQGKQGLLESEQVLDELDVTALGTYKEKSDVESSLVIVEAQEKRIGFLAWSQWLNWQSFHEGEGIVRQKELIQVEFEVLKKKHNLDFLVGVPHWEYEFQHSPSKKSLELAKQLLGQGLDLLVGHHPHVLQPLLSHENKMCFFSLGNLNGPDFPIVSWPIKLGALFEIGLVVSPEGNLQIGAYEVHPFFQSIRNSETKLVPTKGLSGQLKTKVTQRLQHLFPE